MAHKKQDPQSQAYLAFKVVGFQHILVPLAVVMLKKNKDIFMSFSKLQALAQVSGFQVIMSNLKESESNGKSVSTADVRVLLRKQLIDDH